MSTVTFYLLSAQFNNNAQYITEIQIFSFARAVCQKSPSTGLKLSY